MLSVILLFDTDSLWSLGLSRLSIPYPKCSGPVVLDFGFFEILEYMHAYNKELGGGMQVYTRNPLMPYYSHSLKVILHIFSNFVHETGSD